MNDYLLRLKKLIQVIVARSPHVDTRTDSVHCIINPKSGMFASTRSRNKLNKKFETAIAAATSGMAEINQVDSIPVSIHITDYQGHASLIAARILESTRKLSNSETVLFIFGGDGTHQEVLSGLLSGDRNLLKRVIVFRFPAGTGNDGADAWTIDQAVQALIEGCQESKAGAVEFSSQARETRYSFNIASLGIDAYVGYLTNKLKKAIPGNFYKPLIDIGVLFYKPVHGLKEMTVTVKKIDGTEEIQRRTNGITVLGVSGFRTYGDAKWILPGDENFCSIVMGSPLHNLKVKASLLRASHGNLIGTFMASAREIRIEYAGRIVMQLDGEVEWLEPEDFPIRLKVIETPIRILTAKQASKLVPHVGTQEIRS